MTLLTVTSGEAALVGLNSATQYVARVRRAGDAEWSRISAPRLPGGGSGGVSWSTPPQNSSSPGDPGDVAYDDDYFYLRTSQAWRQVALQAISSNITITQQPQSTSVEDGQQATFAVLATAPEAISYQWSSSADGVSFAAINGATSNTLSVNATLADNGSQYRALLSAAGAADVTTNIATLTVSDTFRLLTANNDTLLTETGDTLNHDGVNAGNGTGGSTWSLVNAEIEPYRSTGWLQVGGNGTLVSPYLGNDLVLADNGTAWQTSLTRAQYDSATSTNLAIGFHLGSKTRNSDGDLVAELLLARDANVLFGMGWLNGNSFIHRLQLQSNSWSLSPSAVLYAGSFQSKAACSRNGDFFVVDSGSAYITVYDASGASWSSIGTSGEINLSGALTNDTQVRRLGISNDGLVCSIALENTHDAVSNKFDRIRSFEFTGVAWVERTALTVAASYVCDWTPDHSRVVVGQYDHTGTATQGGRVQVFALSGSTWSQVGSDILGGANYDHLGYSVSISSDGNTIAIGVRGEDDAAANAGAARVYEWSGSAWQQVGADIDGEAAGDQAGDQVELSGGRVAISAPGADGAGTNLGQVRVFTTT